ncbi:MAG: endonuclease domain-containing protein [Candidatus Giovannonibacteria bacterium]|nr:endonuclease domain-containing protein [Candidatus Giovannonibacteria bacterium]
MKSIYNKKILKEIRRELRRNLTLSEEILWQCLNNKQVEGKKFFRQYSVGPYILDFYCPKVRLAIELDGESHLPKDKKAYDTERTKYLKGNNIKVIRFWNDKVVDNINGVLSRITSAVQDAPLKVRGVRGVMKS